MSGLDPSDPDWTGLVSLRILYYSCMIALTFWAWRVLCGSRALILVAF